MKSDSKTTLPRRHFLQQLLLLGGATGTAAIALQAAHVGAEPQRTARESPDTTTPGKGYRLTDHIRTYYEKARL